MYMAFKRNPAIMPVEKAVEEYLLLRDQESSIKKRKEFLANLIKEDAEKNGSMDDKGSYYHSNDLAQWGKQAKHSIKLNEERAMQYIKDNELTHCITVVEIINEDALEQEISCGGIPLEDFELLTDKKTSYSVVVTKKDAMVDVEESTIKLAAQRK